MTVNDLIYQFVRPLGGLKVAKYFSRRHPRVLMYHRINDGNSTEGISVCSLRWQLKQIKENFRVLSLHELVEASTQNALPYNAVALTFDDGYRDFYDLAYPLLQEFDLPATLFITTGFVSGDLWLWPDQIRHIINNTEKTYIDIERYQASICNDSEKKNAWSEIADICLGTNNNEKFRLIDQLSHLLEVPLPKEAPAGFEGVTWSQVCEIANRGLVSIGSHSVSHPSLTKLSTDELNYELSASKQKIETETGFKVHAFCYPNGQVSDINKQTREAVIHAGYEYALAAYTSPAPLEDRWTITRYSGTADVCSFEKILYGLTYLGSRRV